MFFSLSAFWRTEEERDNSRILKLVPALYIFQFGANVPVFPAVLYGAAASQILRAPPLQSLSIILKTKMLFKSETSKTWDFQSSDLI